MSSHNATHTKQIKVMHNWSISHPIFFRRIWGLMILGQEKNFSCGVNAQRQWSITVAITNIQTDYSDVIAWTRSNIHVDCYGHAFMVTINLIFSSWCPQTGQITDLEQSIISLQPTTVLLDTLYIAPSKPCSSYSANRCSICGCDSAFFIRLQKHVTVDKQ